MNKNNKSSVSSSSQNEQDHEFGQFGGQYVPVQLKEYLEKIDVERKKAINDEQFCIKYMQLLRDYVGRPSPLYFAERLSKEKGCKIYLKREDLNHTGAHKINNTIGQALLAKRMGKKTLIAETGAGQHGVATATTAALLGMKCIIFMGKVDTEKERPNMQRMQLLGARVKVISDGGGVLKDAVDAAIGYLMNHPDVFYVLGSVVGPHPYPTMVRDFQKIIGEEAYKQILEKEGKLPTKLVACVGGGSNAMGLFYKFLSEKDVQLIAVEPAGKGLQTKQHAATLTKGKQGIIHGFRCLLLQDKNGNPLPVHSIASGLDYPGVGPEPSFLKTEKRMLIATATDKEALEAFHHLSREEGIIPALESAHAIAYVLKTRFKEEDVVIINLSGRGDKDLDFVLTQTKKR